MFQGTDGANICGACIEVGHKSLSEAGLAIASPKATEAKAKVGEVSMNDVPKPKEIKDFLDKYIIGQDEAKRSIAVAVYNHYKRLSVAQTEGDVELDKSNIVLVGPTGTGKTLIARTIARLMKVPFTIVDATVLTQAGYVGEDVESILSRASSRACCRLQTTMQRLPKRVLYLSMKSIRLLARATIRALHVMCRARAFSRHSSRFWRVRL